ncbi:integral membrane protein [Colletotrichum asianum]|uniref:Integral membrane protein n=1 Tax=Colletotrichum asianum TaxID=702518 RepID=A0A8H3ZVP2_9PEZI|nr:integral membrane protein [Colletotrichum asianum]
MGHLKSILTMSTSILQRDEALPPDEDIGPASVATAAVLTALMIITTSARIWVRAANRKLGWDDWTILIASGVSIVRFAFVVKQQQYGNGRHRVYLSDHDYMMINMYGWWGQILLFLAVAFLKVSICLLILRIKDTKVLKILLYTIMAGVLVSNFGVVIILVAECQPVGFWRGKSAKCWPTQIRIYSIWATIAFSALTDLICSLLPLAVVWNRKIISITYKTATSFGIARAASLGITTTDLSWAYCIAGIWSNLELFLGIIAANLALSRSIWVHFFGSNDSHAIPGSTGRSNPTESGYVNSKLRGDQFEVPSTMPGIQKKTEFWWTEDDESQSQTPLKR